MTPKVSMRQALEDPNLLGALMHGPSWAVWRALLIASRGEQLTAPELALFTARTGRPLAPTQPTSEMAFIAGRRSGKTVAAACYAVYLAALCDHRKALTVGEHAVLLFLAQSQRTAKVAFQYACGLFETTPLLRQLVVNRTADTIELSGGVDLEIRPASFRGLRGVTAVGVIADELGYWYSDDSANPDVEVLAAVRPALATTGGPLLLVSSPYARRGELWDVYRRHFGPDGDPDILVAHGASRDFNETLPQAVVDRAIARDSARFRAEYLAEFRSDVETFIAVEAVRACVDVGVRERAPEYYATYSAFIDPAGGSGGDSMTLAVAHLAGKIVVLDCIREVRPPFSPAAVVENFVQALQTYQVWSITGDRWAGEWVREPLEQRGISYEVSDHTKSEIYQAIMPSLNSRAVALLDNDRLERQLVSLERKVSRGGRDSIDHPPGGHDDVANAVCGALLVAQERGATLPLHRLPSHAIGAAYDPMATPEENLVALAREEQRHGYFIGHGLSPTWVGDDRTQQYGID